MNIPQHASDRWRRNSLATAFGSPRVGALCLAMALAGSVSAQDPVPFVIDRGEVMPAEPCAAVVTVIGCAIGHTAHGGYVSKVTLQVTVTDSGGTEYDFEPFGPFDLPVDGNINTGTELRKVLFGYWDSDAQISVTARSWFWDGNGNRNSDWDRIEQTENSGDNEFVVVLRNGDIVPDLPGLRDQASVEEFLAPYIDYDTTTLTLGVNQAIYLFELASSNPNSPYFDLQDAVVLVTLGETLVSIDAHAMAHD